MSKNLKPGMLVKIRRKDWHQDSGEIATLVSREYLAYETKFCRWSCLCGSEVRIVYENNLYPVMQ